MRHIVSAIGLLFCPQLLGAQTTLSGRVLELSSGKPLACVSVLLLDSAGVARDSQKTWVGGTFELRAPAGEPFRLRFISDLLTDVHTEFEPPGTATLLTREYRIPLFPDTSLFVQRLDGRNDTALIRPLPNSPGPRYPPELRQAGIEGDVFFTYMVDTLGRIDVASAIPLRASQSLFLRSVERALPRMRYLPWKSAQQGHCVRVVQPFAFRLAY